MGDQHVDRGEKLPGRLEFTLGSLGISKDGDAIFEIEWRTSFSTMPGLERESAEIRRERLDRAALVDIWARLRRFDFSRYAHLGPTDFVEQVRPSDTAYHGTLSLTALWQVLRQLDFVRFVNVQRDDFNFRPQIARLRPGQG